MTKDGVIRAVLTVLKSAGMKTKMQKRQKMRENLLKVLFFLILKVGLFYFKTYHFLTAEATDVLSMCYFSLVVF